MNQLRFVVVVLLVVSSPFTLFAQNFQRPVIKVSQMEVMSVANDLLQSVNPSDPKNAYMPAFMKDKINWVYQKSAEQKSRTGKDMVQVVTDEVRHWGEALMYSSYTPDNHPFIGLLGLNLLVMVRIEGRTMIGVNQTQKNTFAASLVHEAVHLERPREWFFQKRNKEAQIEEVAAEEFRTWSKVDQLVVTPLIDAGQPIGTMFLETHRRLVGCQHKLPCKAMMDVLRQNVVFN